MDNDIEARLLEQIRYLESQLADSENKRCRMEKELEQLRGDVAEKADEIKAIMTTMEKAIITGYQAMETHQSHITQLLDELDKEYDDNADNTMSYPLDLITYLLHFLIDAHTKDLVFEIPDNQLSTVPWFQQHLFNLRIMDEAGLFHYVFWFLVKAANQFANNPAALCYQIICECETHDEPNQETLRRLKPWLDTKFGIEHNIDKIHYALTMVRDVKKLKLKQNQVPAKYDIDERTYRRYLSWWNDIENKAATLKSELNTFVKSLQP